MKTFNIQIKKTSTSSPEWIEILAVNEQAAKAKVNSNYIILCCKEEKFQPDYSN